VCVLCIGICPNNSFPPHLQGDWYSIDQGMELHTLISPDKLTNELTDNGVCSDVQILEGTMDAQGNYDAKLLIYNQ